MRKSSWLSAPPERAVATAAELPSDLAPVQRAGRAFIFGTQGKPCGHLHFIQSGYVSLRQLGRDGNERLLDLLGPGDLFGEDALQGERLWQTTAVAVSPVVLRSLDVRFLPRLAQFHPRGAQAVVENLSKRVERTYRRMDLVRHSTSREQVLNLLTTLASQYDEWRDGCLWLALPLRQSDLADLIGIRRETMVRALGELEAQALIRRQGRRGIWFTGAV